jgi:hypothetical protein
MASRGCVVLPARGGLTEWRVAAGDGESGLRGAPRIAAASRQAGRQAGVIQPSIDQLAPDGGGARGSNHAAEPTPLHPHWLQTRKLGGQ